MSNVNTQWRITVSADTARARSEITKFAKTAQMAGMSMEEIFSNVDGAPVARTFNNMGRELNRMNSMVQKSKVHMNQWNRYWKNSNNLVRYSKQLQTANSIAIEKTNGTMTSATAVMRRFNQVTASTTERLAYMNTFFRAASRQSINAAKNIQWAGRQITVGFGVPFGLAMTGASMAFFQFEEQLVRFRKVFNDEINDLSIEQAEERITNLANTMATQLGMARNEIMETSALFAQMGYRVEEIERLTRATTELAMLGETDAQSAGMLLRAYSASGFVDTYVANGGARDEFEDYIKNMLNAIENNTGLSIASMVEAGMAQLIPLFSQMGVGAGIGESILAGMTEALGGRTSEAVTALKAIMQRVYDESAETTEQFGLLGVDIQGLQQRFKSDFVGLIGELGQILANNPAIQGNNKAIAETFGNLFGIRQANRAIAGLRAVSTAFEESGEAANDYGRALRVVGEDAENALRSQRELEAQAESVGGQFRRLKEAILIEAANIGESFLELIMPLVQGIRSAIEWFGSLSDRAKNMAMGFGLVVVAAGGILTTMGVLTQAVLYMGRTIGFFLPKFKSWTEENLKQRIATDHVNEALREQRTTLANIVPLWESIEQAMKQSTRATHAQAQALERLNNAGGPGPTRINDKQGRQARWRRGNETVWAWRHKGRAISDDEAWMRGYGYGPTRNEYSRYGPNTTMDINNVQGSVGGPSLSQAKSAGSVRWRGGAAAAGGIMGTAGMFMSGGLGQSMFAAGIGLETAALYGPRVQNYMNGIAEKMAVSATKSKGLVGGLKASGALGAKFLSTATGMGVAVGAVAAAAFLIKKNIEDAGIAANNLRTEFSYAAEVADELGLEVGDAVITLSGGLQGEEFEQASDAMKSLLSDVRNAESADAVQRIFRNLARQWLSGGATIDQINEKLNELEAKVGVSIDEVDLEGLSETIEADITGAIERAFSKGIGITGPANLEKFFFGSNIWADPFGQEGTAAIESAADTFASGITQALSMSNAERADSIVNSMSAIIEEELGRSSNPEAALDAYIESLSRALGINEQMVGTFDSLEDVTNYYYASIIQDQNRLNLLTDQQRENLDRLSESSGVDALSRDAQAAIRNVEDLGQSVRQYTQGIYSDVVAATGLDMSKFTGDLTELSGVLATDTELLRGFIGQLIDAKDASGDPREIEILTNAIRTLADEMVRLNNPRGVRYNQQGYWEPIGEYVKGATQDTEEADETAEDLGESNAKSYTSSFRSAMDSQRNDVVQSILDNFDAASEARMERLEDERDARLELLEQQRDDEIEALEDARDAELDALEQRKEAIDEYLDKQKQIKEAMQEQLDLAVALASGDRAGAGQIQNTMRFGVIEDMANAEKKRLDEEADKVRDNYDERIQAEKEFQDNRLEREKELYDTRIRNEESFRDRQRENLETSLEELDKMFIGTQEGWNSFLARAEAISGQQLPASVKRGFRTAIEEVKREAYLDSMWDNVDFRQLQWGVTHAIQQGVRDAEDWLKETYPVLELQKSNVEGGRDYMHTGGSVGGGPPKDVPIIAQTGEFMIQRKAAKVLGEDFLHQMNNAHKYHTGGEVTGWHQMGHSVGSRIADAVKPGMASVMDSVDMPAMDPSSYGGRSWGKAAPNTLAAQAFIKSNFGGVRGAYASVDRGDPRSDHSWGKALDVMTTRLGSYSDEEEKKQGWQVANFFRDNPEIFGTKYVIWQGLISSRSKDDLKKWRPYTRMSGPTGGHYDHVHLSFLHSGGVVGKDGRLGLMKGGVLKANNVPATLHRGEAVLRAPVAKSLEAGIERIKNVSVGGDGVVVQIENFHGTDENIDKLANKLEEVMDRRARKVNPRRAFA